MDRKLPSFCAPLVSLALQKWPSSNVNRVRARTQSLHKWTASLSRRELLRNAATVWALPLLLSMPPAAEALSKKRILAKAGPEVVLDSGVRYRDLTIGKGYSPQKGDSVAIHYSLFYDDLEVESSRESQGLAARPLGFTFGTESGPGSVMKVSAVVCSRWL